MREQRGLSQQQLANRAKVSQSTIGNLEAGIRKSPRQLLSICRALDANPAYIEDGRGNWQAGDPAAPHVTAWPFHKIPFERFAALDSQDRGYVQRRLLQAIEECEGPHKTGEITPLDEKTIVRAPPARGKVKKRADR